MTPEENIAKQIELEASISDKIAFINKRISIYAGMLAELAPRSETLSKEEKEKMDKIVATITNCYKELDDRNAAS